MQITFSEVTWADYQYWQQIDKKTLKRINQLIQSISCIPFDGIGKPEPLKFSKKGLWSRRINQEHRLVYFFENDEITIVSCRFHYHKK